MFDDPHKRTFFSAPQSVTSLIAALLEPGITVLAIVVATIWFEGSLDRPAMTLCLFVLALTFPGRNRFGDKPLAAAVDIATSWLVLLAILAMCGYATQSFHYFDDRVVLAWGVATPILQWLATMLGRWQMLHWASSGLSRRSVVIVGGGPLGVKVARALHAAARGGDILGYFDDRGAERTDVEARPKMLGNLSDVGTYVATHGVREVYITLPLGSQPRIVELLERLQATTASLCFVPDVFGISIIQGRLQDINGVPVVGICETPFTGTNLLVKRVSDIVIASVVLLLISPLLLAIAIGVKASSPGPVIFRQRRNGLDGDEIVVWKFRTMTTQDDGDSVPQATRGDPRITRFGGFLRKTSLDELPQFFNVLQGTMSVVGPRPHAVTHNDAYREIIKAYMVRHKVKPGITGWAQVNGLRGQTDTVDKMRARVEYDLEYLRNWSLGLDLRIIFGTIRVLFFDRHAY